MINAVFEHYIPIASVIIAFAGLMISNRRNRFIMEQARRDTDKALTSLQVQVDHITGRVTRLHKACETIEQETFKNTRACERAESKVETFFKFIKIKKGDSNG